VAGESNESIASIVEKKINKQRGMMKIDSDTDIDLGSEQVRLPTEKRIVESSLQRIDESNEPEPQTNTDWNKATI